MEYFGHLMWRVDSLEKTLIWEGLGAGGEGDSRGWDGWMASPTQWTWVWVNSGSWRWTGRPGLLQFMESQRVGHDWATELNWIERWNWRGMCRVIFFFFWQERKYLKCFLGVDTDCCKFSLHSSGSVCVGHTSVPACVYQWWRWQAPLWMQPRIFLERW